MFTGTYSLLNAYSKKIVMQGTLLMCKSEMENAEKHQSKLPEPSVNYCVYIRKDKRQYKRGPKEIYGKFPYKGPQFI